MNEKMFLWWVQYRDEEWGMFVIAPTRNKAKVLFLHGDPSTVWGEYTEIRARKWKEADGFKEGYYDQDCPELEALGVRYMTEEEMDEYESVL